ncbi:flagellin, partial [Aliarcobacter trophiarum]
MKDLGKIGSMQVDAGTAEELNITGEVRNLAIHNTEDIKLNGDASSTATTNNQLKVTTTDAAASGALIGGQALASLGNLSTGELTAEKAAQFQGVVDSAISSLNSYRADIGSTQNQVESAVRNLMTQSTNVQAAESI